MMRMALSSERTRPCRAVWTSAVSSDSPSKSPSSRQSRKTSEEVVLQLRAKVRARSRRRLRAGPNASSARRTATFSNSVARVMAVSNAPVCSSSGPAIRRQRRATALHVS